MELILVGKCMHEMRPPSGTDTTCYNMAYDTEKCKRRIQPDTFYEKYSFDGYNVKYLFAGHVSQHIFILQIGATSQSSLTNE